MKALPFLEWFLSRGPSEDHWSDIQHVIKVAQFYNRPLDIRDFVALPEEEPKLGYNTNVYRFKENHNAWRNRPIFEGWGLHDAHNIWHDNGEDSINIELTLHRVIPYTINGWLQDRANYGIDLHWNPHNEELKKLGLV